MGFRTFLLGVSFFLTAGAAEATSVYRMDDLDTATACSAWRGKAAELGSQARYWHRTAVLARLSTEVYRDLNIGETVAAGPPDEPLQTWTVVDRIERQPDELYDTGVFAVAFRNVTTSEVVVAVRGSENTADWVRNLTEHGRIGDQHLRISRFTKFIDNRFGALFTTVTGHSRGGQLAAFGALMSRRSAVVFNASVLPDDFVEYARAHGEQLPSITNVVSAVADIYELLPITMQEYVSSWSSAITGGTETKYAKIEEIYFGGTNYTFAKVAEMGQTWIALEDTTDWEIMTKQFRGGWDNPYSYIGLGQIVDLHSIARQTTAATRIAQLLSRAKDLVGQCP